MPGARDLGPVHRRSDPFPELAESLPEIESLDVLIDSEIPASRAGGEDVPVELSDAVMPGVVSLPHGYGHDRDGVQMEVAQNHAGVSINDITDEQYLDKLSGIAALNGVPVTVARI